jgi:RNA polymerase sigma-54 factor
MYGACTWAKTSKCEYAAPTFGTNVSSLPPKGALAPRGGSAALGHMKQGLSLRHSQHLALTPALQQSIRLLQLSTLELAQEVEQMLIDNPFLEAEGDEVVAIEPPVDAPVERDDYAQDEFARADFDPNEYPSATQSEAIYDDITLTSGDKTSETGEISDWEGEGSSEVNADSTEWGNEASITASEGAANKNSDAPTTEAANYTAEHTSLADHLHAQARCLRLSDGDRAALMFLIESLNDDGYLTDSLEELALSLAGDDLEEREEVQQALGLALRLLQHMAPTGVGARGLAECLQIQLRHLHTLNQTVDHALDEESIQTAQAICAQPLDFLAKRDFKRLALMLHTDAEQIKAAMGLIAKLDPKPGRQFADVERNIVIPDVIVRGSGIGQRKTFTAELNPAVMPRLKVHDMYAGVMKPPKAASKAQKAAPDFVATEAKIDYKSDAMEGLQQRLTEARWFIKNVQQRFDTILRVSRAIIERQHSFFQHGALAMRPLVLREIADELGLHESTISRVTTAKYMATPFGTFELKYFFGSALGTETGGNASSTAVRALIVQFVAAEDPAKPLSDNQLADMLKEQGIECARRTVAKYREALRIAPTNLRKTL